MDYRFHPACLVWPILPDDELKALAEDIARHGLRHPVVRWRGAILDGRNRLLACEHACVKPTFKDLDGEVKDDAAAWDYTFSVNGRRRHLGRAERRKLIDARLKATPERSNRRVARELGTSPTTVSRQRERLESTGQIGQLPKTTGLDGKQRPARRAATRPAQAPAGPAKPSSQSPPAAPLPKDMVLCERKGKPPVMLYMPNGKPPRLPGQVFAEESKLVLAAIENMTRATKLIRQCEAENGFGESSVQALRKAYAALGEAMKEVL